VEADRVDLMTRRWLTIRVELLHGRGEVFDPPPGRNFVVPPGATFDNLGEAIDLALARWDLSHLRQFTLEDGTAVVDEEMADELRSSAWTQTIPRTALLSSVVARRVRSGSKFTYVFDFGDDWTHACTVMGRVDPLELLGIVPDAPMAFWGWGSLPDQYGRRWDGDDGESPPPTRPAEPPQSPDPSAAAPPVDLTEFRRAVMAGKVNDVIEALAGVSIVTALQQVGTGLVRTYRAAKPAGRRSMVPIILSVLQRLQGRGWAGDALLADEMLVVIRDEEFPGEVVAVDLGQLSFTMSDREGGYLNRRTGETLPASATDPMVIGEEYAVDLEDPDWLHLVDDNRESWRDMEDFAESVADPFIRQSLAAAVHGKGAFSRFRGAVHAVDLGREWHCFSDDRRWGRARQQLADHGLRPG